MDSLVLTWYAGNAYSAGNQSVSTRRVRITRTPSSQAGRRDAAYFRCQSRVSWMSSSQPEHPFAANFRYLHAHVRSSASLKWATTSASLLSTHETCPTCKCSFQSRSSCRHIFLLRSMTSTGGGDAGEDFRGLLKNSIKECEEDECKTGLIVSSSSEYDEEEGDEQKDERLQKDGLHTSLFSWLVHRMPGRARQKLPSIVFNETDNRSCWALAFCGFLWTSSTCMVFSLLPVFLKTELGYSNTRIGAIEGAALLMSNLSRIISGVMSDVIKSRVKVIALGSAMTAAMKLVLASAVTSQWVVSAKLLDRFGKGVRAAPTDALIADLSPRQKRSTTYSLHQSLTTLGGVFGSLCAVICMTITQNNYRLTFRLAALPSLFAIFMLLYFVRKPVRLQSKHYGMPKYPERHAPSKRRHGRGPLAIMYEPVRWRRSRCKDSGRDMAWHRGKRTWRLVSEWLTEHLEDMKSRAQEVKEKRPGELLFPQLSRYDGESEEIWQIRQREWEAEYLSTEEERTFRHRHSLRMKSNPDTHERGSFGWSSVPMMDGAEVHDPNLTAHNLIKHSSDKRSVPTVGGPLQSSDASMFSLKSSYTGNLQRKMDGARDQLNSRTDVCIGPNLAKNTKNLQSNPRSSTNRSTSSPDFKHTEEQKVVWGSWRWSYREAVNLPWPYWRALLVFTVLKVARFSEAFVTLHANAVGLKAAYLPMLMVATNLIQSLLTYPLGVVADRVDQNGVYGNGQKFMLLGGFGMMIVADLVLVLAKTPWQVFVGYLAVGVHMAMTQANMKAVLSATMPPNVRGTGFAISALSQGIALGAGNYMAGRLCDLFGSSGAFWGGGAFATAALGLGWLLL